MKKNIIYILGFTILIISCEKSTDVPTYNLSKESLAYVQIPVGKYFIYKDSVSGNTDSVIVTESKLGRVPHFVSYSIFDSRVSYYYQSFTLSLSKVNGNTSILWFNGIAGANANENDAYRFGTSSIQKILPNIIIEGKDYSDVVQVTYSYSSLYYCYYWAKGIGIIKRTEPKGASAQTWTLLRRG